MMFLVDDAVAVAVAEDLASLLFLVIVALSAEADGSFATFDSPACDGIGDNSG